MRYPKLVDTLLYEQADSFGLGYIVKDKSSGIEQLVDREQLAFMLTLDGNTDPYNNIPDCWSKKDVKLFLNTLKENSFVKCKIRKIGVLSFAIPLIKIKRITMKTRAVCLILNFILMVSFLPVCVAGCMLFVKNIDFLDTYFSYLYLMCGLWLGTSFAIVFHECGHAVSGLSYGNSKVYEAGLIVGLFFGAYVGINSEKVKERRRRIQITAGGIEVNLLISGIAFIVYSFFPQFSSLFAGIGIANIILAFVNIIAIFSLDGAGIVDELLGTESLFLSALIFLLDRDTRQIMLSQGIIGYLKITACAISSLFQLAYPALMILNFCSLAVLFK